ncbi:MAG: rRNA pseudouridine synthase [Coriobacteriia bacterium]|nr:rRNA pseudouridine synthase [Coriobacteriia bacterium]MCL2870265.1 rRNA pseudouridine synthase [Coriobacteriia bacterium]
MKSQTPHPNSAYPLRLQKFLSRAGVASRRGSENLMTEGRVSVNGHIVRELGIKIDPVSDIVAVDGKKVRPDGGAVSLMLNKPTGVLTTMSDPHGRPTVAQLIADAGYPALFPVGRLDQDTSGLLLFTTDGELGYKLTHPKYELFKTYQAHVKGQPNKAALRALQQGMQLEDGMTAPAKIHYSKGVLTLSIREGRNRQVRRMCEAIGHPVQKLHRTHFGPLALGTLREGNWRHLEPDEVSALVLELKET